MTVKELLFFKCIVCNTTFLSYVFGQFLNNPVCKYDHNGTCFYDNELGELHSNHVLNPLENIRKCCNCRVANQLEEFM